MYIHIDIINMNHYLHDLNMHLCIYVSMYLCIYASMYVGMHACMYVYVYIYIYMYTYGATLPSSRRAPVIQSSPRAGTSYYTY